MLDVQLEGVSRYVFFSLWIADGYYLAVSLCGGFFLSSFDPGVTVCGQIYPSYKNAVRWDRAYPNSLILSSLSLNALWSHAKELLHNMNWGEGMGHNSAQVVHLTLFHIPENDETHPSSF